tara:strand:+ start:230 stop:973 length:744 start_codon:yes stop_codon:yes gene_type:complete
MALTKIGKEGITGISNSSDATAITISSGEVVTLADDLIIKDSGTIGSASKTDAITIASSGLVQLTSTGIGAGSQVFQVIDDGATLFQLRAEDGNVSFPQSGAGIYLGVTSGTAANLLDDYEEGTWTAQITGSSSNPSSDVTLTSQYTKVGNEVYVCGQFSDVNTSGMSGGIRITGLPFAPSPGNQATGNVMLHGIATWGGDNTANITPYFTGSYIAFYGNQNNAAWFELTAVAGTGKYISFSGVYKT